MVTQTLYSPPAMLEAAQVKLEQIRKAKVRAEQDDLAEHMVEMRPDATPGELCSPAEVAQRRDFLNRSLGDPALAARKLERVLEGNELQPINYLARGAIAARAIARVEVNTPSGQRYAWGTGFLIAPGVLLTNNHVLPGPEWARNSRAHFLFEADFNDNVADWVEFDLDPQKLFYTSKDLDFAIVAVRPTPTRGNVPLDQFGSLPLLDVQGKANEGEWLTIIQHPNGEPKQLCVRENRLIKRGEQVLWYSTDTLGGSSGSPVFNNDWYVVALHHMGVPDEKDGKVRAIDGNYYDPAMLSDDRIKWIANEGVRASRIVQALKAALPNHPLLVPMYTATPQSARVGVGRRITYECLDATANSNGNQTMTTATNNFTLPMTAAIATTTPPAPNWQPSVADTLAYVERARPRRAAAFDAPFDSDYSKRKGYDEQYLGKNGFTVNQPTMGAALAKLATKLLDDADNHELKYNNFSVVMHSKRRFAIYSAANLNFGQRYDMARPTDVWREDPRIPLDAQVTNFLYAANQFDRGHLTRREDLEYGPSPVLALQSAADTCHWTNCTPQHAQFNQNKEIWQGIERHILEGAILHGHFKAAVITGPVLDEGDPEYKKIQYPVSYWKVVAAINAQGKLAATAYLASQAQVIDRFGIEAAPIDPFGPFKLFQVPIAEVQRVTRLTFTHGVGTIRKPLTDLDPLGSQDTLHELRRRRRFRPHESTASIVTPEGYVELNTLDDIISEMPS